VIPRLDAATGKPSELEVADLRRSAVIDRHRQGKVKIAVVYGPVPLNTDLPAAH
jgi:hypothetical protein